MGATAGVEAVRKRAVASEHETLLRSGFVCIIDPSMKASRSAIEVVSSRK